MTRRYGRGRGPTVARSTITRGNKYAGECHYCGDTVPPMAGIAEKPAGSAEWRVLHRPAKWVGSPTSGGWQGGCPGDDTALNAAGVDRAAASDRVETFDTDAGTIDVRVIPGELDRATVERARAEMPASAPTPAPHVAEADIARAAADAPPWWTLAGVDVTYETGKGYRARCTRPGCGANRLTGDPGTAAHRLDGHACAADAGEPDPAPSSEALTLF